MSRRPAHEVARDPRARHPGNGPGLPGPPGDAGAGLLPAGPMDHLAHRAANLLVGNPASAAALEITLGNFRARLEADATIAVCGAEAAVTVDGDEVAVWESHRVPAGAELRDRDRSRGRLPLLPRDRRRLRRAAPLRLPRDVHDGRARRVGRAAAAAGRPASAGRRRRKRRGAPARGSCAPASTRASGRCGRCAARRRRRTT